METMAYWQQVSLSLPRCSYLFVLQRPRTLVEHSGEKSMMCHKTIIVLFREYSCSGTCASRFSKVYSRSIDLLSGQLSAPLMCPINRRLKCHGAIIIIR